MNYLLNNGPPLRPDEDSLSTLPFDVPFTNQASFQSTFTPAGFSFQSPFGLFSTPSTYETRPSSSSGGLPNSANALQTLPNNTSPNLSSTENGGLGAFAQTQYQPLSNVISDGFFCRPSEHAPTPNFMTGDRFSQLLEAKLGPNPSLNLQNNADRRPRASLVSQLGPTTETEDMSTFDRAGIEQVLRDYSGTQTPSEAISTMLHPQQYGMLSLLSVDENNMSRAVPSSEAYSFSGGHSQFVPSSAPPSSNNHPPPPPRNDLQTSNLPAYLVQSQLAPFTDLFSHPFQSTSNHSPHNVRLDPGAPATPLSRGDAVDGSWAMELLKGYKSAQNRLQFPDRGTQVDHAVSLPHPVKKAHSQHTQATPSRSHPPTSPAQDAARRSTSQTSRRSPRQSRDNSQGSSDESAYEPKGRKRRTISSSRSVKKESAATVEEDGEKKPVIACHMCRARKLKCNGVRPKCANCVRRNEDSCEYDTVLRRRGPGRNNKKDRRSRTGGAVATGRARGRGQVDSSMDRLTPHGTEEGSGESSLHRPTEFRYDAFGNGEYQRTSTIEHILPPLL